MAELLKAQLDIETIKALQEIKSFVSSSENNLRSVGKGIGSNISSDFAKNTANFGSVVNSTIGNVLAQTFTTGISQAGNFLNQQFSSASGLQTTRLALNGLLGSADKAGAVLKEVVDFAAKTPFEIPELADTAKLLAGYGVSAENIVPALKSLGDAAAGTGTPIGQIARNFAQIQTQGKAGLIDLRQFAGAGIPIFGQLQKTLGKSKDEIENLATTGKITSKDIEKAFQDMSKSGGPFFNAMKNLSDSVGGRISTLSDTFGGLGRRILGVTDEGKVLEGGLFAVISNGVLSVTEAVSSLDPKPLTDVVGSLIQIGKVISTGNFDKNIFGFAEDSIVFAFLFGVNQSLRQTVKTFEFLGSKIKTLSDEFSNLVNNASNDINIGDSFQMLGEVLTDGVIVTSLGLIAIALASIAVSAVITASPFIALGLAVGGVIAIFKNFETVKQFLEPVTTLIGGLITTLATPELFGVFNSGLSLLGSLFATLQPTLIVSGILLAGIFGQLFTFGQYTLTTLYPVLLNLVSAFLQFAEAVLPPLIFVIGALITVFSVQLLPILQVVGAIFTQVFAGILMSVTGVITVATGIINIFVGGLKALITGDLSQFSKGVGQVFDGIKAVIAGAVKTWLAPVTGAIDGITNFLRGIDLAKIGLDLINNLANGIRNGAGAVGNAIKSAFANISLPLGLKVPAFADGGLVQGRNTLAMLNDGGGQEFVMNARATRNNFDLLRALNSGKIDQSQINNKQEVNNFSTRVDQYSENNPRFKK